MSFMQTSYSKAACKTCLYLVPFLILMVAYSPSFAPFGLHNDYSFLELKSGDWWLRYDESWLLYRVGRPVAAALMSCQMLLVKSPVSFVYWRIAAVMLAVVLAWQFAALLRTRAGYSRGQSVCWGTLFLLLPAAQVSVVWLTMVILGLVASPIGLLAYRVMPDIHESFSPSNIAGSFRRYCFRYAASMVLLVFAMLIYPINALLGLVITAAIVLSPRTIGEKTCVVVRDGIVFGASMIIYFILVKYQVLPLARGEIVLPMYQLKLSFSLIEQLKNLMNILAISAASPWHVITGMPVGIAVNLALLCLLVYLVRKTELPLATELATASALLLLVLLVANSPVLLAPKGFYDAYRTGFASQAMVWLVIGAVIGKLAATRNRAGTVLVFVIVAAALGCTLYNCILVRRNCTKELADITAAASQAIAEKKDLVYRLKVRSGSFDGWPPRFEFALPVTHVPHLAGALSGQYEAITAARVNIAAIDEDGAFRSVYGAVPKQNALVFDMQLPVPAFSTDLQ